MLEEKFEEQKTEENIGTKIVVGAIIAVGVGVIIAREFVYNPIKDKIYHLTKTPHKHIIDSEERIVIEQSTSGNYQKYK